MAYTDLKITDIDNNKEVASKINTIIDECLEVPNTISNSAAATLLVKDAAGEFKQASKYSIVGEAQLLDWKSDKLGNVNHLVGVDTENQQYILSKINNVTIADEAPLSMVNTLMSNIPGIGISSINIDALLSNVMFLPSNTISGTSPQNDLNTITDINLCIYITGDSVFYTKNIPENALNGFSYPILIIENLSSFKREYKGNELTPDDGNISKPSFPSDERTMLQKLTIVDSTGIKIYYRTYMYAMLWGNWVKIKDTTETIEGTINLETQVTGILPTDHGGTGESRASSYIQFVNTANLNKYFNLDAGAKETTLVELCTNMQMYRMIYADFSGHTITDWAEKIPDISRTAMFMTKYSNVNIYIHGTNLRTGQVICYYTNDLGNTWTKYDLLVSTDNIKDGSISTTKILDSAVTSAKIAAKTIVAGDIADNTITATQIAANAVTSSELAANAVVEAKIASNAVTTAKIKDASVTDAKISGIISKNHGGLGNNYGKADLTGNINIFSITGLSGNVTTQQVVTALCSKTNYIGLTTTGWIWKSGQGGNLITDLPYNPSKLIIHFVDNNGILLIATPAFSSYAMSIGVVNGGTFQGWKSLINSNGTPVIDKATLLNAIKADPASFRSALGLGSLATLNSINLSDTTKTTGILPSSKGGFDYHNYLG